MCIGCVQTRPDHAGRRLAHDHMAKLAGWRPAARNAPSRKLYTEATEELGIHLIRQVCHGDKVSTEETKWLVGIMLIRQVCNGDKVSTEETKWLVGIMLSRQVYHGDKVSTEEAKWLVGIMLSRQVRNGENVLSDSPRHSSGVQMVLAFQWKGPRAVRPWLSRGTIQLGSGDPRDAQQPNTTTLYSGRYISI
jgi:hypothetical protein